VFVLLAVGQKMVSHIDTKRMFHRMAKKASVGVETQNRGMLEGALTNEQRRNKNGGEKELMNEAKGIE
jgi:hypothetical protein